MMKTFAAVSLALVLAATPAPAPAAETVRPVPSSLGASGVMFDTRAKANGETYRIHVALPPGMEPGARYPVVYLLDADWHFPLMAETVRLLVEAGDIAPVIVVGIGYRVTRPMETITLRTRDFTVAGDRPHEELIRKIVGEGPVIRTGGADAFLAFIQQELKPAIAARFPADNGRTALFGHSLGGTFGLNVLFRHPESFTAYGLSSPPVLWGEEEALKLEADRAAPTHAAQGRGAAAPLPPIATSFSMFMPSPFRCSCQRSRRIDQPSAASSCNAKVPGPPSAMRS